jgi:hypothetical protein
MACEVDQDPIRSDDEAISRAVQQVGLQHRVLGEDLPALNRRGHPWRGTKAEKNGRQYGPR